MQFSLISPRLTWLIFHRGAQLRVQRRTKYNGKSSEIKYEDALSICGLITEQNVYRVSGSAVRGARPHPGAISRRGVQFTSIDSTSSLQPPSNSTLLDGYQFMLRALLHIAVKGILSRRIVMKKPLSGTWFLTQIVQWFNWNAEKIKKDKAKGTYYNFFLRVLGKLYVML